MHGKRTHNSIRTRTFSYMMLSMVLLIIGFTVLFFGYQSGIYEEEYATTQLFGTEKTAESVGNLLTDIRQNSYYLCCNESLAEVLVNDGNLDVIKQGLALRQIMSVYTDVPSSSNLNNTYACLLLDEQFGIRAGVGRMKSLRDPINTRVYSSDQVSREDWYQQTLERGTQVYAFLDEEQSNRVFFTHMLRNIYIADSRYTNDVGVMLYIMPKTTLNNVLRNSQISGDSISLLVFDGKILCSTDEAVFAAGTALTEDVLPVSRLKGASSLMEVKVAGGKYAMSGCKMDEHWQVLTLTPAFSVWNSVSEMLPLFAASAVILIALAMAISSVFAARLSAPISRLAQGMRETRSKNELLKPIPVPKADREIEYLYESYNEIAENILHVTEMEKQKASELQRTELKALQSQINPHFLYNTLDSVNCIALMNGEEDIAAMVTSLISILKYSVHFTKVYVSLREEINYLQQYITIQKLRFRDNFRFTLDIPEQFMQVQVAKLMIQPLVENALFHAENSEQMLEIRVWCEEKDGQILIHVCDNGTTADAEQLNRNLADQSATERFGIGIRNVNRRIHLMTGEEYGIHYERREEGGLDAVIRLPHREC